MSEIHGRGAEGDSAFRISKLQKTNSRAAASDRSNVHHISGTTLSEWPFDQNAVCIAASTRAPPD
jgi:hypothetical protein